MAVMIQLLSDPSLITASLLVTIPIFHLIILLNLPLKVALYILAGGHCPHLKIAVLIQMKSTQKAAVAAAPGTHRVERFILITSFPIAAAPYVLSIHHLKVIKSWARVFTAERFHPAIPS